MLVKIEEQAQQKQYYCKTAKHKKRKKEGKWTKNTLINTKK